ncbi:MAG: copper amine oxidase N-terminal domain-containing protein [Oscillospiraceae bacterium]|nr:copper amine oxidase N-terminal domain-containing protein [Oscillospiraceae bacterium]
MATTVASAIDVNVNNTRMSFDVEPCIMNERTMVPMRAIFEVLGANIDWNGDTQTVTATRGSDKISLTIGSTVMTVNGTKKTLDSAPVMVDNRTLVPVRAISEALGSNVSWDDALKTVNITDNSGLVDLSVTNKYAPAWKTAYSDFLNSKKSEFNKGKFKLIYLNDDDIPEIAISDGIVNMSTVYLYTYTNSGIAKIDWENVSTVIRISGSLKYKERTGLFALEGSYNGGYGKRDILSWNGGMPSIEHEFEMQMDLMPNVVTYKWVGYKWNGDYVSEDAYRGEWERMTADYKTFSYNTGTGLTSANIKSALGL